MNKLKIHNNIVYVLLCCFICLFLLFTGCGTSGPKLTERKLTITSAPPEGSGGVISGGPAITSDITNKVNIAPQAQLDAKSSVNAGLEPKSGWSLAFLTNHSIATGLVYGYSSNPPAADSGEDGNIKENHDEWVSFTFDKEYNISEVFLYPRQDLYISEQKDYDMYGEAFAASLAIEVSKDGTNWNDVVYSKNNITKPVPDSGTPATADNTEKRQPPMKCVFTPVSTKYIRVHALSLIGFDRPEEAGQYRFQLYLVEIYADK